MTPYEVVRYPGRPRAQTHPDRLCAIGHLFGLNPAPVERCRVLELGCGEGANLVPMAYGLPGSRFVGIDLAATAIADGRNLVAALGLRNLDFAVQDLASLPGGLGEFDYVIAHGVYSWVPPEVRDALLAACARHLAPQGIAFVSYNALPGGHVRRMLREMMRFHVQRAPDARTQTAQALALVKFLAEATPADGPYGALLREECQRLLRADPAQLYHDDLAAVNDPVYFHEFAAHAARHGLRHFADAELFAMSDQRYSPAVRDSLATLGGNRLLREQYLDFLACRRFRQSLLCRADAGAADAALAGRLETLRFSSMAEPETAEPSLAPGAEAVFRGRRGATMRVDLPLSKAALLALHEASPRRPTFAELQASVAARLARAGVDPSAANGLAAFLQASLDVNAVEVHAHEPDIATTPGERPRASALARLQSVAGTQVTSLTHRIVDLTDDSVRRLLRALDGSRDWAGLRAALAQDERALDPESLERHLQALARLALLEA